MSAPGAASFRAPGALLVLLAPRGVRSLLPGELEWAEELRREGGLGETLRFILPQCAWRRRLTAPPLRLPPRCRPRGQLRARGKRKRAAGGSSTDGL